MVKDGGSQWKPTWSGNGVLLPPESFFKRGESSSSLHLGGLRAQVGGQVPRLVDPFCQESEILLLETRGRLCAILKIAIGGWANFL